jgi:hypothetical protein
MRWLRETGIASLCSKQLRSAERSEVAPSIYEGFELRRTNTRKRLTVDLDCPTAVYLKAPLASASS